MTTVNRSYRFPGPDLQRIDLDATAAGNCMECSESFDSFEDSTRHATKEQHVVRVQEIRLFDIRPRSRQEKS